MNTGYPPQLAGKFVVMPAVGGGGHWQGQFVSDADTGMAILQLFSWMTGEKTVQKLVSQDDLLHAEFFDSAREWQCAAARASARWETQRHNEQAKEYYDI